MEWVLEKGSNSSLIRSLIEVRSLIEPTISRWAAERATAVDLVDIEASYNEMAANPNRADIFHEADIRFHRAVLVAAHNVVMKQLNDAVSALQRAIFDFTFERNAAHMTLTINAVSYTHLNSLSWMSIERSSTALTDPYCFTTFFRVTLALSLIHI